MIPFLRTKYFQFVEHSRQQGFWSACKNTLYKYEEMVPTAMDLDSVKPAPAFDNEDLSILELGPENFFSCQLDYPLKSRFERARVYFPRGYRTFVLVEKERHVIGDMWYVSRESAQSPDVHPHVKWFGLDFGDRDIYGFDLQINADQRGGGLATAFHSRVLEMLRERGFRRAYGCYVAGNLPALWMHRLIGYRELPRCIVRRYFLYDVPELLSDPECRNQRQVGKRMLDLLLLLTLAPVLLPLLAFLAILVRVDIGQPVFFGQERPGRFGKPFTLYKFRTMTDARDSDGRLLPDGQRLTRFGRFLRSTSMDELPELFNVLKGDMSLVGPRPLLMKYLPYFTKREKLRHSVYPGITGWAQIHGRNYLPWDQRLAMDVWYAENWSLRLDLKILAITLWKVLCREKVAPDTDVVEPYLDQIRSKKL